MTPEAYFETFGGDNFILFEILNKFEADDINKDGKISINEFF